MALVNDPNVEGPTMKCMECGGSVTTKREDVKYDFSGLPGVTLKNIEVSRCAECDEYEMAIPRIEELHGLIAGVLIAKRSRLTPEEIRFLRKLLGWSGADFAKAMGTTPETVSRWENGATAMGVQADRLLRLTVAHLKPIDDYGEDQLRNTALTKARPVKLGLRATAKGWREAA
jgi:putative zinc finger/helix-turn-helix YgiT family protein